MKPIGRALPGLLLALASAIGGGGGCAKAPAPESPESREVLGAVAADVVDSRFGVVLPTGQGDRFRATRFVLLVPGTTFGWAIRLAEADRSVSWREEYRLPAAPVAVAGAQQSDATVVRREGRDELRDGWLSKTWILNAGDPLGRHVIDVFVDGRHVHTFEFDVLPPPSDLDARP